MGLSSAKAKSSSNEGWGLGLLLVFFPDEEDSKYNIDKRKKLSSSSSSSSSSSPFGNGCSSSNSATNLLSHKAQSTLTISFIIVFFTLFVVTLLTFERTVPTISSSSTNKIELRFPRRWLSEQNFREKPRNKKFMPISSSSSTSSFALQGMGTSFRRGTKAMTDLIVAHIPEETGNDDIRLFLRALHRSGLTSKSDLLFIFPSPLLNFHNFTTIIQEENESFLRLVHLYRKRNGLPRTSFDVTQFVKPQNKKDKQGSSEPIWGQKLHHVNHSTNTEEDQQQKQNEDDNYELNWGSVVGFEASELDPENSLSGFLQNPPLRLRRWACYPMLLGRVRRNFKHVMLVDVKDVVILGDLLSRVRSKSSESVSLWDTDRKRPHGKKSPERLRKDSTAVVADVIGGGMRGIRRLSTAVLNEIVRTAVAGQVQQRKSKMGSVSDSGIVNQLVHNESLLKSVNVIVTESQIADASSKHLMVSRGNGNFVDIGREICSSTIDSSTVYSDCY